MESTPIVYIMNNHQGWGDTISFLDHKKDKVYGCLKRIPKNNDILYIKNEQGQIAFARMINVEHKTNPEDLFFADIIPIEAY